MNTRGYLISHGNGALYPAVDRLQVVRLTTCDGRVGWGETYGLCAPRATCEIINDLPARLRDEVEAENRLTGCALRYMQPEMAHTGVTQFLNIARLAAGRYTLLPTPGLACPRRALRGPRGAGAPSRAPTLICTRSSTTNDTGDQHAIQTRRRTFPIPPTD